jgi:NAD(P)-dependent dehydrogenase (short-subunit alcohol dehydrogenase family)
MKRGISLFGEFASLRDSPVGRGGIPGLKNRDLGHPANYNEVLTNSTAIYFRNRKRSMNVLISGSRTGIGLATAIAFAEKRHRVFAGVRDAKHANPLAEVAEKSDGRISILELDVTSECSVRSAIDSIFESSGIIDALVNNAGVERMGSVEESPLDDFRACLEVNYLGALRCIQAVLPAMRKRREGTIVNLSSVGGRIALSPNSAYCASKFALESLSETLAQEMKPFNVRVFIIEPGLIHTEMAKRMTKAIAGTKYAPCRRLPLLFAASMERATAPSLVGNEIAKIVLGDSWQLRHTVGPDADGFFKWRESMSDEEWIEWSALDDKGWLDRVRADFGIDLAQLL